MLTFDIAGAQIDGARDYQEDAFLITRLSGSSGERSASLAIVADGMGGHAAGNVASNMAVQTFNKHLTSHFPSDQMPAVLREAVLQANNSITETVRETAALKGMGCTLVAVVIDDKELRWVSVGDSHLYLVRDGKVVKKNADHSYGGFLARMAEAGKPIEPEAGFSRNMLMSALTGDEIADIDCPDGPLELQAGDRVVIASDGLDTLSHGKLLAQVEKAGSAKECVDALLKAVQDARMPRQDNTTAIVVMVGEKSEFKARPIQSQKPGAAPSPLASGGGGTNLGAATRPPPLPPVKPIPRERDTPADGAGKLLAALLGLLVLAGGAGAYWYFALRQPSEELPPALAAAEKIEPLVNEEVLSGADSGADDEMPTEEASTAAEPTPAATPTTGTGETFTDALRGGGTGPKMVWLPAGTYQMGSPDTSADFSERPQHAVTLKRFAMSQYEITIADYARFASATGRRLPKTGNLERATHPVFFVSWDDALAYTQWLSTQTGQSYRLPSEAEWEYGARAGTQTPYWWGRDIGAGKAHCFACDTGLDPRQPTKIGRFPANPYGLYDTAGNVEEWVYDCWHDGYEGAPGDGAVFEGGDCSQRVVRGGAYSSGPKALRSTTRGKFAAGTANDSVGFRVVRD
ncbi:MAG TPA: SUMF1/EgtB/PvdO family nonheme iron enzyme [Gammaproteobacteria bacterium]|nr:SUMF1/EgtB/PvdO family nonheme iron enzyme [Gammaproteobacteria bacterium]